jgi:hypothetical protein
MTKQILKTGLKVLVIIDLVALNLGLAFLVYKLQMSPVEEKVGTGLQVPTIQTEVDVCGVECM